MGEFGEFCKDMKAAKKQRAQKQQQKQRAAEEPPAPPKRRCYDWMIVGGTAHYAKNRSSFITYRRVARRVKDTAYGIEFFIAGIGTVELRVCSGPGDRAPVRTLVLENVLHAPSALCNGFSIDLWSCVYGGEIEGLPDTSRTQLARDNLGEPYWYAVPFKDLEKLVLAGDPQGESYLDDGPKLLIGDYLHFLLSLLAAAPEQQLFDFLYSFFTRQLRVKAKHGV